MALYMSFYIISDATIEFLEKNPTYFPAYLTGDKPTIKQGFLKTLLGSKEKLEYPLDWPTQELEPFSPEISHRQVNDYHYLLNGSDELVDTVTCLFQTWFKPKRRGPAMVIDGENFSFTNKNTKIFLDLIEQAYPETVESRLAELKKTGTPTVDRENIDIAFLEIIKACKLAVANHCGILWTAS